MSTKRPSHIAPGLTAVTPYLIVDGAARLLDFLTAAFGADELDRHLNDDGSIAHATAELEGCRVELSDARPEWPARPGALHFYVSDADACYRRALEAGATSLFEPADMPYGERSGGVQDPTGNHWYIATWQQRPEDA